MIDAIWQQIQLPDLEDDEQTQAVNLLNTSLLAILTITGILAILSIISSPNPTVFMLIFGFETGVILIMLALVRAGRVQVAGIVLVSLFWMLPTSIAYLSGGLSAPSFSSYITVVLMAGIIVSVKAGVIFAILSSLVGLIMLYAQTNNLMPPQSIPDSPLLTWVGLIANIAMAVVLMYLANNSSRGALSRARKNENALAEANRELRNNRLELIDQTIELTSSNKDLKHEIIIRKKIEHDIKNSINEKEVLLKEIHHRVKNNLQIISSLLYLQSKKLQDEASLEIFTESQNRIRAMALIHEKLYQSDDLAKIEMGEYIQELAQSLFTAFGIDKNLININVNAKDVFLSVDLAIPCGVIINELVSNALKYAFPDNRKGDLWIDLIAKEENLVNLQVRDNGSGIPKNIDLENTNTLGLKLVRNLAKQLGGSMKLVRTTPVEIEVQFFNSENI